MNRNFTKALLCIAALFSLCACAKKEAVRIVAHRGFWNCEQAGYAQNSIASLRCAQEAGFWGSECDVHLTLDDSVVVFHDNKIGSVVIKDEPWSAIADHVLPNGEKIPFFGDYLYQVEKCPTTVLVLEIKEGQSAERDIYLTDLCIAALKDHGLYDPSKVIFISFSWPVCEYLAGAAPEFVTEYLRTDKTPEQVVAAGVKGVDGNYRNFLKDSLLIPGYLDAGLKLNAWTVDDMEVMQQLVSMGVTEITTNVPDLATATLAL